MRKHKSFLAVAISFTLVVAGYEIVVNGRAIGASMKPFATTFCASASPCIVGSNSSTGIAVEGGSANGRGVYGVTKRNSTSASTASYGVEGQDASTSGSYDSGLYGLSNLGTGVTGKSTNGYGVSGASTNGYGVSGASTNGSGVSGASTNGSGVSGASTNAIGVVGIGAYGMEAIGGTGGAIYASTSGGNAIFANTGGTSVWALVAQSPNGSGVQSTSYSRGVDSTGGYAGVVARSSSYPLIGASPSGTILFYFDSSGNLYTKGTVNPGAFSSTTATSNARTASPAIEDTGTAHLAYGTGRVYLSPSFARSVDPRYGYQVFLTPGGDTRGLYVAGKYARGFIVREVQGGHSSIDFDYHVYAHTEAPAVRQPLPALPPPTHVQPPASLPSLGRPR